MIQRLREGELKGGPEACRAPEASENSGVGELGALSGAPVFTEAPQRVCRCCESVSSRFISRIERVVNRAKKDNEKRIPRPPSTFGASLFFSSEKRDISRELSNDSDI